MKSMECQIFLKSNEREQLKRVFHSGNTNAKSFFLEKCYSKITSFDHTSIYDGIAGLNDGEKVSGVFEIK